MLQRVLVWDVPTRVFHWALVLAFAGAYLTAETERYRDVHLALGYLLLGLLGFRLVWGFVGTAYARFRTFLYAPTKVVAYVRSLLSSQPQHFVGHNPAGGVAIFLLLGLGLLVSASGLGLDWELGDEEWWEELHEIAANGMLLVVFVHIAGVAVSSVLHRESLVKAMVTGYKVGEAGQGIPTAYAWLGGVMVVAMVSFLVVYLL